MMQVATTRPDPTPSTTSRFFWEAAAEQILRLQHCDSCDRSIFYPRERCPYCWSSSLHWRGASGRGLVASYTVVHRPGHPAFEDDAPYVVALIDLDEGARILSNVVECDLGAVRIGLPVIVRWTKRGAFTLPQFAPSPHPAEEGEQ